MGGGLSRLPGKRVIQTAVDKAGLPLQVDGDSDLQDAGQAEAPQPVISEQYEAEGWFVGVRSTVVIKRSPVTVYNSLKTDLHKVFTPMTECHDEIEEDDPSGRQRIFRIVRIPFRVAFVTGNLKLRLKVEQSPKTGEIHFDNLKEGRLISTFVALFKIRPPPAEAGDAQETTLELDTKIALKRQPPGPFKGLVKGVMVHKIDMCMCDLVRYHGGEASPAPRKSLSSKFSSKRIRTGKAIQGREVPIQSNGSVADRADNKAEQASE